LARRYSDIGTHCKEKRLLATSEEIQLVMGRVLCEPGVATRQVDFPVDGFISMVAPIDGKLRWRSA
jgi:hypothetical protein